MFHSHANVSSADLAAGSRPVGGMNARLVGQNAVSRPSSNSVKAGIKEFMRQEAMGSHELGDTNGLKAEQVHSARTEHDQIELRKADLLDKVENVIGEISEVLNAPYEEKHMSETGSRGADSFPLKSQMAARQNAAGPQSAYMKTSLSTINEDGPLDEKFAAEWEASKKWKGNSHVHGILLPDWHVWAEQVSQLLNHFATEIGILTSRVECIDQRLKCQEGEIPRTEVVGMQVDNANPASRSQSASIVRQQQADPMPIKPSVEKVVVVSPSLDLTAHELDWLMAPDNTDANLIKEKGSIVLGDARKSGAVLVPVAADGEKQPRHAVGRFSPGKERVTEGSPIAIKGRANSPVLPKRTTNETRRQVNSPPPTKVFHGKPVTSPRAAIESHRHISSLHQDSHGGASSSTIVEQTRTKCETVPVTIDLSPQSIRSEAEKERLRRLKEMQEWRLQHAEEMERRPDILNPPPQLPASPALDKFRSPPLPTRANAVAGRSDLVTQSHFASMHAAADGPSQSALSNNMPRLVVESPVTSLRAPPGSSTGAPSSSRSRTGTSPWSDSSGQETSPRHEPIQEPIE